MLIVQVNQQFQIVETINSHAAFPVAIEVQPDSKVESLVTDLTSNLLGVIGKMQPIN